MYKAILAGMIVFSSMFVYNSAQAHQRFVVQRASGYTYEVDCVRNGVVCNLRKVRPLRRAGYVINKHRPVRRVLKGVYRAVDRYRPVRRVLGRVFCGKCCDRSCFRCWRLGIKCNRSKCCR